MPGPSHRSSNNGVRESVPLKTWETKTLIRLIEICKTHFLILVYLKAHATFLKGTLEAHLHKGGMLSKDDS